MKRIVLMVLYNLFAMPRFLGKAYYYAKHTDEIDNDKKYKLLKEIVARANKGGRIRTITSGQELLPAEETFMLFPNHQGLYDVLALIHTCPYFFSCRENRNKGYSCFKMDYHYFKSKVYGQKRCAPIDDDYQ